MNYTNSHQLPQKYPINSATVGGVMTSPHRAGNYTFFTRRSQPSAATAPTAPKIIVPDVPHAKRMAWGEPTWFFFHTLAEKVTEDNFGAVRSGLLNIIYSVCVNLHCPECASHAKQYLEQNNFNGIQTKHDLKLFLFNFHNTVNTRKQVANLAFEELNNKYQYANLKNICYYFIGSFEKKNKNIKLIADDNHRQRISNTIKQWLNANIGVFMP